VPWDTRGARFTRSLRGQACADGLILGFEERSKRMRRSAVCSSALQSPTPTHRCPVRPIAAIALAFAPRLRRNTSDHSNGRGTTIPPSEGSRGAIRLGWRGGINPYARTEVGHPAWPSAPTSSPQRSCSIGKRLQEMVGGTGERSAVKIRQGRRRPSGARRPRSLLASLGYGSLADLRALRTVQAIPRANWAALFVAAASILPVLGSNRLLMRSQSLTAPGANLPLGRRAVPDD
jgi:hypothetical protein